jgi:hypothetical protein
LVLVTPQQHTTYDRQDDAGNKQEHSTEGSHDAVIPLEALRQNSSSTKPHTECSAARIMDCTMPSVLVEGH